MAPAGTLAREVFFLEELDIARLDRGEFNRPGGARADALDIAR
jgi:hypothetical protein